MASQMISGHRLLSGSLADGPGRRPLLRAAAAASTPHQSPLHKQPAPRNTPPKRTLLYEALQSRQQQPVACSAANAAAAPSEPAKLGSLELLPILNPEGLIEPEAPQDAGAAVLGIFDASKKLQYIGFSKELRASLRTLFSRRPDKALYYKVVYLPVLDQEVMLAIRNAWFDECGGPPPGNKLAMERDLWQTPLEAFSISERGRLAAAEEKVRELLEAMAAVGCREEWVPNAELLQEGKVDFLPAAALTPEERAAAEAAREAARRAQREVATQVDGVEVTFMLAVKAAYETKGGHMYDLTVTFDGKESVHRVIVGKQYYEPYGLQPEAALEEAFALVVASKMPRHTEGMLLSGQFPVNYFATSELDQWYPDFVDRLAARSGKQAQRDEGWWRFNKLHDYGSKEDDMESLRLAFEIVE